MTVPSQIKRWNVETLQISGCAKKKLGLTYETNLPIYWIGKWSHLDNCANRMQKFESDSPKNYASDMIPCGIELMPGCDAKVHHAQNLYSD